MTKTNEKQKGGKMLKFLLAGVAMFAAALSPKAFADTNLTENVTLTADTDWRGQGVVTVPEGVTLDLNGYWLCVDALAGEGTIAASGAAFSDLTRKSWAADGHASTTTNGVAKQMAASDKYPAKCAFDDVYRNATGSNGGGIMYDSSFGGLLEVNYEFETPTNVNCYRILGYMYSTYTSVPKVWTFEGSNDGTNWTELDSRSAQTFAQNEWKTYTFHNSDEYLHYRLKVTAVSGTGADAAKLYILEMEYGRTPDGKVVISGNSGTDLSGLTFAPAAKVSFGNASATTTLSSDVDLRAYPAKLSIDGIVDLNGKNLYVNELSGEGRITDEQTVFDMTATQTAENHSSVTEGGDSTFNQGAWQAFGDFAEYSSSGTPQHRVLVTFNTRACIDYDFGEGKTVNAYRLMAGGNSSSSTAAFEYQRKRAPKSFAFYGSNEGDDGEWVKLDERSNETAWIVNASIQEERQYEFENLTPYRYYRIEFTERNNTAQDFLEFFKLEYGNVNTAGQLHVDTPDSFTTTNSSVAVVGNIRFIKEGSGTFVAQRQCGYGCGTDVKAGKVVCNNTGNKTPFGKEGRDITIREGAVMEMNAKQQYHYYGFTLDGGTLQNTSSKTGYTSPNMKRMRLTKDSLLKVSYDYGLIAEDSNATTVYLNGHKLEVQIGSGNYFRCYNTTILDGTVDITSGTGYFTSASGGVVATNVDFIVDCALFVNETMKVRTYEAKYSSDHNSGSAQVEVYGTFKPAATNYHGCTLQNGAVLDLSAWAGTWPVASGFTANATDLKFASGATVTVKLGDKKVEGKKILDWADTSAVVDTLNFVRGDESRGYSLRKMDDGLYYYSGLMIFVL